MFGNIDKHIVFPSCRRHQKKRASQRQHLRCEIDSKNQTTKTTNNIQLRPKMIRAVHVRTTNNYTQKKLGPSRGHSNNITMSRSFDNNNNNQFKHARNTQTASRDDSEIGH